MGCDCVCVVCNAYDAKIFTILCLDSLTWTFSLLVLFFLCSFTLLNSFSNCLYFDGVIFISHIRLHEIYILYEIFWHAVWIEQKEKIKSHRLFSQRIMPKQSPILCSAWISKLDLTVDKITKKVTFQPMHLSPSYAINQFQNTLNLTINNTHRIVFKIRHYQNNVEFNFDFGLKEFKVWVCIWQKLFEILISIIILPEGRKYL